MTAGKTRAKRRAPRGQRIDHCTSCGAENPSQGPDRCPQCGRTNCLISTWGEAQAERYRTGERYDPNSKLGRRDLGYDD